MNKPPICPFLDLADDRCAEKLTMKSLDEAYRFCFGQPEECPVYAELVAQLACGCPDPDREKVGVS